MSGAASSYNHAMQFIYWLCDQLYPPSPGQIDRGPLWPKIVVLAMLGFLLAFGILANWRW